MPPWIMARDLGKPKCAVHGHGVLPSCAFRHPAARPSRGRCQQHAAPAQLFIDIQEHLLHRSLPCPGTSRDNADQMAESLPDMRLSYIFFDHIRAGTRLVLVGDVDQLPSVGPGNVFRELVQCGVIPVTDASTLARYSSCVFSAASAALPAGMNVNPAP